MFTQTILDYYRNNKTSIQSANLHHAAKEPLSFELLGGDMSYKQFYRVKTPQDQYILLIIPTSGAASIETFNSENSLNFSPAQVFIDTANQLAALISNVSEVHAYDKENGLILLSDHGLNLLEDFINLNKSNPEAINTCFVKLFNWINQFQNLAKKLPADFIGVQRVFEYEALLSELEEFLEFGLLQYENKCLNDNAKNALYSEYQTMAKQLSNQPQALIHRDFQSKNILLENNDFWVIDYQDLCLGPYLYDYASIIFDPYLNLPLAIQENLIVISWQNHFKSHIELATYKQDMLLTAKHRLLKAAGRYAKHFCLHGKNSHMKYYEPALAKLKQLQPFPSDSVK